MVGGSRMEKHSVGPGGPDADGGQSAFLTAPAKVALRTRLPWLASATATAAAYKQPRAAISRSPTRLRRGHALRPLRMSPSELCPVTCPHASGDACPRRGAGRPLPQTRIRLRLAAIVSRHRRRVKPLSGRSTTVSRRDPPRCHRLGPCVGHRRTRPRQGTPAPASRPGASARTSRE